ncbi:jak pathway signal transduction adaptor molecule [Anaeramoeba ignava]|uniref:Jak pathway signal transduction adaptor molecule n=1 Tax=Anaeramoeba ignava TaxID=1746090 RepID=A0A9Q0LFW2_ANAIG|nr:jak pathway signal transduction adaptor molecule [Anaeramoeba ignava]
MTTKKLEPFEVLAIADWIPQDDKELAFKKNDKITIIDNNYNWWVGYIEKSQPGLIPKNFISFDSSKIETENLNSQNQTNIPPKPKKTNYITSISKSQNKTDSKTRKSTN